MSTSNTTRREPGVGAVYYDQGRARWAASVQLPKDANGKRRRLTRRFATEGEAQRGLIAMHREVAAAGGNISTGQMTAAQWLELWIEEIAPRRLAPKTVNNWRSVIRKHLAPALGRTRLSAVTPAVVRRVHDVVRANPDVHQESTVLLAHRVLAVALRDATREGHLHAPNLATSLVDQPRKGRSSRPPLERQAAIEILRHIDPADPLAGRWTAALLAGARQGELLGLERSRVFDDHIDVSWQLQSLPVVHGCGEVLPGGRWRCGESKPTRCITPKLRDHRPGLEVRHLERGLWLTRPKTASGERLLPLVEPLRSIIHEHIAATTGGRHDLVWTRPSGAPIAPRTDSDDWHALLDRAGVDQRHLHAARGAYSSELMRAGIADAIRIALIGHSSAESMRPYEHAETADRVAAMEAVVRALAPQPEQQGDQSVPTSADSTDAAGEDHQGP